MALQFFCGKRYPFLPLIWPKLTLRLCQKTGFMGRKIYLCHLEAPALEAAKREQSRGTIAERAGNVRKHLINLA